MSKEIEVVSIQMLIQGRELTLQQRGDAQQELNRLQSKIEALTKENEELRGVKNESEVTQEHLERLFLTLGSKIADNEITIKNPSQFIRLWKTAILTNKG